MLHRRRRDLVRDAHPLDLLLVLIARAAASSGVASAASGKASNQALVKVVGSPTIRSEAWVPERELETHPLVRPRGLAGGLERARGRRARVGGS